MSVVHLILLGFNLYSFLLMASIVISWIPHDPYHPIILNVKKLTDPYFDIFRQLPLQFSGIDLSPIVAFFVLNLIRDLVIKLLIF